MNKIKSFRPKIPFMNQGAAAPDLPSEELSEPMTTESVVTTTPNQKQSNVPAVVPKDRQDSNFGTLRLIPLGGIGDVTKNMYVYEYNDSILIVDCGLGFPEEGMLGIDIVIPDITYLKDKKHKIKGIVITHGHEDHIGGLPYLWPQLDCPIYAQRLAAGFIRSKFTEHRLPKDKINQIDKDTHLKLGPFEVSPYQVSHSVPDTTGLIIDTPVGKIVHQSDFKLDWTPVNGQVTEVGKLAIAGQEGVLMMLIDGLRVDNHGYTSSELPIQEAFEKITHKTEGKVVITLNSSNITRIQQVVNIAQQFGRKLAVAGRSLENNFQTARDLGYLDVPPGLVIAQEEIKRFKDNQLVIIIAGSQGQPESALSRAANGDHKFIQLKRSDAIVFSANPIPASELTYYALVDKLTKSGMQVYYSDNTESLHVSGHAASEEIKVMINLAKPKYLMPIGTTTRGMRAFHDMAIDMGFQEDEVILPDNGGIINIQRGHIFIKGKVEAKNVYVDGLGVGDVENVVLRDRQVLSEEGIVIVIVPLDSQTKRLAGDVDLISRGFIFEKGGSDIMMEAKKVAESVLDNNREGVVDWRYTRRQVEENIEKYFYDVIKRRPMVLPIVVEV
jgi:ribonuclease J